MGKPETLKMSNALRYDCEFLAAIYCALPSKHQVHWSDYNKTETSEMICWNSLILQLPSYLNSKEEAHYIGAPEIQTDPEITLKLKVRIEGNIDNKSCSPIWVDPKSVFWPYPDPKLPAKYSPKGLPHSSNST